MYSRGLSSVMMLRARDPLISSMSAASVVDLPEPVGPEMMTKPVVASVNLRKSGCRLQPWMSLMEDSSSRMATAMPRTVRKKLIRHRTPEIAADRSAEPCFRNSAQSSAPNMSWAACTRTSPGTAPPRVCRSPRTLRTGGVPASRCRSLAPTDQACSIQSSKINGTSSDDLEQGSQVLFKMLPARQGTRVDGFAHLGRARRPDGPFGFIETETGGTPREPQIFQHPSHLALRGSDDIFITHVQNPPGRKDVVPMLH